MRSPSLEAEVVVRPEGDGACRGTQCQSPLLALGFHDERGPGFSVELYVSHWKGELVLNSYASPCPHSSFSASSLVPHSCLSGPRTDLASPLVTFFLPIRSGASLSQNWKSFFPQKELT